MSRNVFVVQETDPKTIMKMVEDVWSMKDGIFISKNKIHEDLLPMTRNDRRQV